MSMVACFVAVKDEDYQRLMADPEAIVPFLTPMERRWTEVGERYLDLDKSWHAIHFFLTGDPWGGAAPQKDAVMGGDRYGADVVGYGPAGFLSTDRVRAVNDYLSSLPEDFIEASYDGAILSEQEIYPDIWDDYEEIDDGAEYVVHYFKKLVEFYRYAAENNYHIIQYTC